MHFFNQKCVEILTIGVTRTTKLVDNKDKS